jgi:hypothetical protein
MTAARLESAGTRPRPKNYYRIAAPGFEKNDAQPKHPANAISLRCRTARCSVIPMA